MTALSFDMRELTVNEVDLIAGADFWGKATAGVMIGGGAIAAFAAAVAIPATGGVAAAPATYVALGGIATMIAGMEKWEESK